MKNKKKTTDDAAPFRAWMWKAGLLALCVVLLLVSIVSLSRWGREFLYDRDRYQVGFGEIECTPPEVMDRTKFLDQVHYLSSLPAKLNVLSDELPDQLREGFAKHPWVERVDDVAITPPKRIHLKLTYRVPVLAVKFGDKVYAVDGHGIRLPGDAPTRDLPVYDGEAKKFAIPEGTRWGDPNVEAAARKLKR